MTTPHGRPVAGSEQKVDSARRASTNADSASEMIVTMAGRKPGRDAYDVDRRAMTVRVPEEHRKRYEAAATEAGYKNLNDYLAVLLAEIHGLDRPTYVRRPGDSRQEALIA